MLSHHSESPNPYQPPALSEQRDEQSQPKTLSIRPIEFPPRATHCSYLSFEEFAKLLTADLVEAAKPFGLKVLLPTQGDPSPSVDVTIRCHLHDISQYRITNWQRIIKWFLPFLGYYYNPASFTISGTIETPHQSTVSFDAFRKFKPGGLGEKVSMRNGIRAEAIRLVGLAAKACDKGTPISAHSGFWQYVLLVPLVTGILSAMVAYMVLRLAVWGNATVTPDAKYSHTFIATYVTTLVPLLTIVFAPGWVYADRRAAFAYRWISSSSSLTLRVFILICAVLFSFLVALIFVVALGNMK